MQQLIDEAFLKRLANLRFVSRRGRAGRFTGSHASPRAGMSIEFADYREYASGDDFRYIDWSIYGRLDRLLLKTFVQEVDLPVYFLLDLSASMQIGAPPKAHYAAQSALALAFLGLRSLDRVGLYPFADRLLDTVPARHGMGQFNRFLHVLSAVDPHGTTSLATSVSGFLAHTRESGLVILLTDFLGDEDILEPIARLRYRGDDVVALQILDRGEAEPTLSGPTQLIDAETQRRMTMVVGARTLSAYKERFAQRQAELRSQLLERGVPLFVAFTDRPVERLIHEDLRRGGILQ
jgi:uncharacterized protein (DUF58 family)